METNRFADHLLRACEVADLTDIELALKPYVNTEDVLTSYLSNEEDLRLHANGRLAGVYMKFHGPREEIEAIAEIFVNGCFHEILCFPCKDHSMIYYVAIEA